MPDAVASPRPQDFALALFADGLLWAPLPAPLAIDEVVARLQGLTLRASNREFAALMPQWTQFLASWPQAGLFLQGIHRQSHYRTLFQCGDPTAADGISRLLIDAYRLHADGAAATSGDALLVMVRLQKGEGLATCDLMALDGDSVPAVESSQRFRQIVEDLMEGVYIVQHEKIVYANPSFAQSLGYTAEELLDLPSWHVIAAEREWPRLQRRFQEQLTASTPGGGPSPSHGEFVTRHREGGLRRLHHTLHAIQWNGQPAVQGTVIDLTEIHHAQQSLHRRNERLALAIQGTSDGLWDWQIDTDQLWWSPQFYTLLGYGAPGYLPTWSQLWAKVHGDDLPAAQQALAAHLADGERPFDVLLRLQHLSGQTRYFRLRGRCARDAQGVPHRMAGSLSDETEKRQEEMQRLRRHRLETMGQLTGGVAHDFNNLLQVISGNLQLLLQHGASTERNALGEWDADSRECLEAALKAADQGATLTRQLLAFTRNQPLSRRAVVVNDLLQRLVDECRHLMPDHLHFVLDLDPLLPPVAVDPAQLETTLLNLLINARDALPEGGVVRLMSTATTVFGEDLHSPLLQYGRITLEDNGVGMDETTLQRAFEPFFTTKKIGQGAGLGLSSAYGFVKQSGGELRLSSVLGQGTTVTLDLPLAAESLPPPIHHRPAAGELTGARILVVEDQFPVRQFTVRCLEQLGYRVKAVVNGVEALDYLKRNTALDLVFTDMVMPGGMSGLDVCHWVRRHRPELGLLLTTGFSPEKLEAFHELSVLPKPYTLAQLASSLERAFAAARDPKSP